MVLHWFVVASQKEARIFTEVRGRRKRLKLINTITNPLAQEKRKSLIKKLAGHGLKLLGRHGVVRYSENKRHDPLEDAAVQFAKQVIGVLESAKNNRSFKSLTIVAEPHFLGKLKNEMSPDLEKCVTEWIKKDLQKTMLVNLPKFLLRPPPEERSTSKISASFPRRA